ncbi:DeoR/GlpR transcriptional regulator [Sinorhizobium meliloti]|uniref:DeoR/GlpR family DNA-binding transcription regulator n=1 Tax=Rhizobium meliloti TaxID=382 RepID=UPI000FDBAAAC|nr:DeoR/GlpR family DNA-binding transcription regulator [Sinorhizobium meliloti]RVG07694.1 DeoR/GlpR transcriptional regulator [Sinorhizobium meliloti]
MDGAAKRVEMVPAKRRALILEHLRINGAASIQELADTIGGSQSTVRRDLEHLVEKGYLERTHGGAHLTQPLRATFEREAPVNAALMHAEKVAIGEEAAKRLSPGDCVIFDGSSTVMEAVKAAAARRISLTVIVNSLDIAQLCSEVLDWRVIVPGGTVRPGFANLAGQPGEEFIRSLHADVCLTGASAVTGTMLTERSLELASLKRAMIASARRTILLVDSSKFTAPAFCTLCDVSQMHEIITDTGIEADAYSALKVTEKIVTLVSAGEMDRNRA